MKEIEIFEKLKSDIGIIIYTENEWGLETHYGNRFTGKTYLEVLEKANNYAINNNGFE